MNKFITLKKDEGIVISYNVDNIIKISSKDNKGVLIYYKPYQSGYRCEHYEEFSNYTVEDILKLISNLR